MWDYSSNAKRRENWQVLSLALASNPLKVLLVEHHVRFVLPLSLSLFPSFSRPFFAEWSVQERIPPETSFRLPDTAAIRAQVLSSPVLLSFRSGCSFASIGSYRQTWSRQGVPVSPYLETSPDLSLSLSLSLSFFSFFPSFPLLCQLVFLLPFRRFAIRPCESANVFGSCFNEFERSVTIGANRGRPEETESSRVESILPGVRARLVPKIEFQHDSRDQFSPIWSAERDLAARARALAWSGWRPPHRVESECPKALCRTAAVAIRPINPKRIN